MQVHLRTVLVRIPRANQCRVGKEKEQHIILGLAIPVLQVVDLEEIEWRKKLVVSLAVMLSGGSQFERFRRL